MDRIPEIALGMGVVIHLTVAGQLFERVSSDDQLRKNKTLFVMAGLQVGAAILFTVMAFAVLSVGSVKRYCWRLLNEKLSGHSALSVVRPYLVPDLLTEEQGAMERETARTKMLYAFALLCAITTVVPGPIILGLKVKEVEYFAGWLTTGSILIVISVIWLTYKRYQ